MNELTQTMQVSSFLSNMLSRKTFAFKFKHYSKKLTINSDKSHDKKRHRVKQKHSFLVTVTTNLKSEIGGKVN